ncbi:Uncharacterised protein [Mycobacterium tuberculosis]|nr:Uncharacterised protein [Mycobacterium tuberculosis]
MAGTGGPGQHLEGRRVRVRHRIGFRDPRKALDRGSVEADAFLEGALEFGWGDGDRLEETEHVCEPQPDEADVAFFQGTKNEFLLSVHTSNSMHCLLKPCYRCPARSVAGRPARGVRGEFRARTADSSAARSRRENSASPQSPHTGCHRTPQCVGCRRR